MKPQLTLQSLTGVAQLTAKGNQLDLILTDGYSK